MVFARGERVAVFGNVYMVNRETGNLHLLADGVMAEQAGVFEEDATELLAFPVTFRCVPDAESEATPQPPRSVPPPPPPPGRPVAEEPKGDDLSSPDLAGTEPDEPDEPDSGQDKTIVPPEMFKVLDQSIQRLELALKGGQYDRYLGALILAEENGKTRVGAMRALRERKQLTGE